MVERLIPSEPKIGVIIGTHAAVPYIHLHLESARRNYPEVRLLVNDDGSPFGTHLAQLCYKYEADFYCNSSGRLQWTTGDLTNYARGVLWGWENELDIVVKFSRRFIPLVNWVPDLKALAWESDYPTYSSYSEYFGFGFLTECLGMHVRSWLPFVPNIHEEVRISRREGGSFVEHRIHLIAEKVLENSRSEVNKRWDEKNPMPEARRGYANWDLAYEKAKKKPERLWHDCNTPEDYVEVAKQWGLPYRAKDFKDPDMSWGGDKGEDH